MIPISDVELARMWERHTRPAAGQYSAPVAVGGWDGASLTLSPTGVPLEPAAALYSPRLAKALGLLSMQPTAALPAEPTISALVGDYAAAIAPLQGSAGSVATAEAFSARLHQGCRKCPLWAEAERGGRGRCRSVRCSCARRLLWLGSETCPEGRWA